MVIQEKDSDFVALVMAEFVMKWIWRINIHFINENQYITRTESILQQSYSYNCFTDSFTKRFVVHRRVNTQLLYRHIVKLLQLPSNSSPKEVLRRFSHEIIMFLTSKWNGTAQLKTFGWKIYFLQNIVKIEFNIHCESRMDSLQEISLFVIRSFVIKGQESSLVLPKSLIRQIKNIKTTHFKLSYWWYTFLYEKFCSDFMLKCNIVIGYSKSDEMSYWQVLPQ